MKRIKFAVYLRGLLEGVVEARTRELARANFDQRLIGCQSSFPDSDITIKKVIAGQLPAQYLKAA